MKKAGKKNKKNLIIFGGMIALIIVVSIFIFDRIKKYEMAKQDAILIGNLALSKYLSEGKHINSDNIIEQYNLVDFYPQSNMLCPINNKKYDMSVNEYGFSDSGATVNVYESTLTVHTQLICGKHSIVYSYSFDHTNPSYQKVEEFKIDIY